jgi:CHAD domain-containing protein
MVPGLAGFIADDSEPEEWLAIVDRVLAALGTQFTPVLDRSAETHRTTWLDTFDWRLYKAGLSLRYVPARRGGELRLSDRATEILQPVASWQPARAHLFSDLPDGPVTGRIGPLIAPRALLPMAATTAETSSYRLLNEDSKTVVRLLLERQRLAGPGPEAELRPRLTLLEMRGYQAEARRAQALIGAVPGIGSATVAPLEDALRALGRRPGDYSNKVQADITGAMPASQAVATILLCLLDAVDANVDGVLRDTDSEFLHDLRVGVRRTRSALKLFGGALTGITDQELEFFAREFKWVGDLTTPVRDLDVHLLDFEATAHSLAAAKPDDLEPFRAYLEQRRRKEVRALIRGLKSPRFTGLTQQWRARLTGMLARKGNKGAARPGSARSGSRSQAAGEPRVTTAWVLAAERTRSAYAKVAKRGALITLDSPPESLHDLRKRCKELRYALEFFAPLHDRVGYAKVVGDLKRLQDCLGEFQDSEVQIWEIRALAADMLAAADITAPSVPAVTLLAMGEVTAGLAARQRSARADFERRFAAFADAEGQRRMAALLRGQESRGREWGAA